MSPNFKFQLYQHAKDLYLELIKKIGSFVKGCSIQEKEFVWLIFALIIGIGMRGYFLSRPMEYDEAYTFLSFVLPKFSQLFYYPLPNNHVLHSVFVQISTSILGKHPLVIRLPALLSGIGIIPIVFYFSRFLKQSGIFASVMVAVFPYFILFSTNARGYMLLVFLTLGLAFVGFQIAAKRSISQIIFFALLAALGMFTIPSMLFSIAGIYVWVIGLLLIKGDNLKRILKTFIIPSSLLTTIFTLVLYIPVIIVSNGIKTIVGNRFVESQSWQSFFEQIIPHFKITFEAFSSNIPYPIQFMFLILLVIGIYGSIKKRNWPILLILPSVLFGSAIVFIAKHKIPFARTWIFLIPFALIVADYGFTFLTMKTSYKYKLFSNITILIVGIIIAGSFIYSYPNISALSEAQIIAKYLQPKVAANDIIDNRFPMTPQMQFYLWYYDVPIFGTISPYETEDVFYIVYKKYYSITDMTKEPVIVLFDFENLSLYQLKEP